MDFNSVKNSKMELNRITPEIFVSPQIKVFDMAEIKDAGFKAIICNRPDGEAPDQPTFTEIHEAAQKLEIEIRYVPVVAGKICAEDINVFGEALNSLPRPLLAYCKSGKRSVTLWSIYKAKNDAAILND